MTQQHSTKLLSVFILLFFFRCDRNAGGNYIPRANDRVQIEGHFVTDGVCVCVWL